MDIKRETPHLNTSTLQRAAWRTRAAAQGLVCFVCGEIPDLERRGEFYDTGLCGACASELQVSRRPVPGIG